MCLALHKSQCDGFTDQDELMCLEDVDLEFLCNNVGKKVIRVVLCHESRDIKEVPNNSVKDEDRDFVLYQIPFRHKGLGIKKVT